MSARIVDLDVFAGPEKPHEWQDITGLFGEAAQEMVTGQLVKLDEFSLYEAMSALELMDPKMDAGMNTADVVTLDEALQKGLLKKSSSLHIKHVLGIMDKLMTCENMYFNGQPFAQTLLTCLYLHSPTLMLDDMYLNPFCMSLLRRAVATRKMIIEAEVFEEEDFLYLLNGWTLYEQDETELSKNLSIAEDDLTHREKILEKKETPKGDFKPLQEDPSKEGEYVQALLARIRYSRLSLKILKTNTLCTGMTATQKSYQQLKPLIDTILATHHLAEEVPQYVFQSEICRRVLSPSAHPRNIVLEKFTDTVASMQRTTDNMIELCNIMEFTNLETLEQFVLHLVDNQGANIVVRSRFMKLLVSGDKIFGKYPLVDWVIQNGKTTLSIPDLFFEYQATKGFLANLCKAYVMHFSVLCSNKARRRRKLSGLLRELSVLVDDGELLDFAIARQTKKTKETMAHYFVFWMLDKTLRAMISFIRLGFELELYDQHEYNMLYWYMDSLLFQRKNNHLMVLQFNQNHLSAADKRGGGKSKPKKGKAKPKAPVAGSKNLPTLTQYHHEIEAEHQLVRGIIRFLVAMKIQNKLPKEPELLFGSREKRFCTRFDPFFKAPTPVLYWPKHFYEQDFTKFPADDVLDAALDALQNCKAAVEKLSMDKTNPVHKLKLEELKTLAKVAITNSVQLSMIKKLKLHKDETKKLSLNFPVSPIYVVLSLQ